jgi:hypothetical protein|tara:strand:- start:2182 stop:3087 length:906 start_codon:yes stop_codon:yes gene_type:complete
MRWWGFFLVSFLLISTHAWCAELSKDIYFRGYDYFRAGATNERVKRSDAAMQHYLRARECFVQLIEKYPTYAPLQVRSKLSEVEAKLRPLLVAQGIAPELYLKPPRNAAPNGVAKTAPLPKIKKPSPVAKPVVSQGYEQILAQMRADMQRRDLEKHQMEAKYQAQLREAMAARPKALEPGELTKQVTANESLKKDFEYLKMQSRKGENSLFKAAQELDQLHKENASLQRRLSEAGSPTQMKLLSEENQSLRIQIAELRRAMEGLPGLGSLQSQLAKERQRARKLEAENVRLRKILTDPNRP